MSKVKDSFFGGAEKKAAKQQAKQLRESQRIQKEAAATGRGYIQQGLRQQLGAFETGNIGAQNLLLQQLPLFQGALLGQSPTINYQPIRYTDINPYLGAFLPETQAQIAENRGLPLGGTQDV